MQINKNLSLYNFNAGTLARIKYLVIHFTANDGDTAYNNTKYFQTYRGSSAHYFVDENSIWQSVEDQNIAWHCGATSYKHSECRNTNSIGIELCSRIANGAYYFKKETVNNAVALTKYLMKKYNIPVSRVVRHYDVTGKNCPAPYVSDITAWNSFLKRLEEEEVTQERFNEMMAAYNAQQQAQQASDWAKERWAEATAKGIFDGTMPKAPFTREQAAVVLKKLELY